MQGSTRIDELRQKFHENPRRYFAPLANEYRKAGDPEQAIAICRAHLAQQPGHMSGHVVYGQALYDAKRPEEARGIFEKALALDPDNSVVLKQLGDIARAKGETSEARHWYSRAVEVDPSDRETAAYLAELAEPVTERAEVELPAREEMPLEQPTPEQRAPAPPVEEPEPVALEQEVAATEQDVAATQHQVPIPEPSREPEVVPTSGEVQAPPADVEEPAPPAAEEVSWRKTPMHEESPFVTRTMAELYARQGYRESALDVYRQLALQHPDDIDIANRIEALEKEESRQPATASPSTESEQPVEAAKSDEVLTPREEPVKPELVPFEPIVTDLPVESTTDTLTDLSDDPAFAHSSEDLNLDALATFSPPSQPHFTETELGGGDTWDTDSWGAGFGAEQDANLDFDSPDVPASASTAPQGSVESGNQKEQQSAEEPERPSEPAIEHAPETEQPVGVAADEIAPAPGVSPPIDLSQPEAEDLAEEPAVEGEERETARSAELAGVSDEPSRAGPGQDDSYESEKEPEDASHVVAYSPQPPEDQDLPHYAPKGPTVRDFFATLHSFRPSPGSSITAHGGIPAAPTAPDNSLASDAFASLFPDSPVNDEDSRAAFALSGALGASGPPSPPITTPDQPQASVEQPVPTAPSHESEEDIRRFREWLDGLAET